MPTPEIVHAKRRPGSRDRPRQYQNRHDHAQEIDQGRFRCPHCGRMFFIGRLGPGTEIEPQCPRCGVKSTFVVPAAAASS